MGKNLAHERHARKRVTAKLDVSRSSVSGASHFAINGSMEDIICDLNSEIRGIYLYLNNRVQEGALLELVLPNTAESSKSSKEFVRCIARVVRVEETGSEDRHGVAAVIEQYSLIDSSLAANR